jgi:hypothetical protein
MLDLVILLAVGFGKSSGYETEDLAMREIETSGKEHTNYTVVAVIERTN